MVIQSANLVRPRTIMQEQTLKNVKPNKTSIVVLTLCGACLFLLIISAALLTSLVLVGRNLSYNSKFNIQSQSVNNSSNSDNKINSIDKININLIDNNNSSSSSSTKSVFIKMNPNVSSKIIQQLRWRLPSEIRPKFYNLRLYPDLKAKTFSGNISIQLQVSKPISYIVVHSKRLTISQTLLQQSLDNGEVKNISIANAFEYPEYEYWVTEVNEPLAIGDYVLGLTFNGSLTDRIVGFYQSSYVDPIKNETRYMATSKFEPTYARQAYPCFDEPAMKAKYKVSLVKPLGDGYIALSNMDQDGDEIEDLESQTALVTFKESVPMSSYLSCFIVSDFKHEEKTVKANGIGEDFLMRVYATPAQLNKVDFALQSGVSITEYYIKYFMVPYPLPKLDMAAIPDFVSGAMEHWGLVTFRETGLLYDVSISSTVNKQRVASVVAHELAHMWFGNLVTMAWWNELWLNEGFATYISYKGVDHVQPDWKMSDQFLISDLHGVLGRDATLATHPIVQPADNPDQITELFDSITYSKGASIIRMLENMVGENNFQTAVKNYLEKNKYGNAVTEDLLAEIDNLNLNFDDEVQYIMSTWTKQEGLPVVSVEKVSPTEYRLTQKRFFSNPENENATLKYSEFNYRWYIPITYKTDKQQDWSKTWFKNSDTSITINVPSDHKWIKLNHDQIGYYRIKYSNDMWNMLTKTLIDNIDEFSVSDRAHLLNDAFSLAESTQIDYRIALDLTNYLANENAYVPWSVASSKIGGLKNYLYYTELYSQFKKFGINAAQKAYQSVGWEVNPDEHLKNQLRTTILNLACSLDMAECLKEAGTRFDEWLNSPQTKIPSPDLRSLVYYYGMANVGNEDKWNQMWNIYKKETDAQEKAKLMSGLSGVQVPWILKKFIDLAWDEENVRGQDYFTCLQSIAGNPVGESLVWDYVRANWEKLVDRFGLNERYLGRMIPSITGRFNTELKLQEVKDFFERYPNAGAGAAARQETIENIQNRIKWLENNQKAVAEWLNEINTKRE